MEDITHCSQENNSPAATENGSQQQHAQRTLDDLVTECREYIVKRNASARERVPEAGKPMYLISKTWLKRYKEYILMADVKRNNKPHIPEVHTHPGPISNDEDLCEVSKNENMTGTGTVEQFEKDAVDKYLRLDVRERF
jgi:hypothetical protein